MMISAGAALGIWLTASLADKKPWDLQRFTACISALGKDPLDVEEGFTSAYCKVIDWPDKNPADLDNVTVDPLVFFARRKTEGGAWQGALTFLIGYQRKGTAFGGDAASGFARYSRATMLLNGKLREFNLERRPGKVRACGSMGSGLMRVDTCGYDESVYIPLDAELIAAFRQADTPSGSKIKVKFFGEGDTAFTMDFRPAEVVAVANAVALP
jgi:hypothetical protein